MSYNFDDLDLSHAGAHNEDANIIKGVRDGISKKTTACKDQEIFLHIFFDKEAKLKEDIVSLKVKLVEAEKFEEGMRKQYKIRKMSVKD